MAEVVVKASGLHIRVAGKWLSGWEMAQVKVGVEVFPNEFTVVTTLNKATPSHAGPVLSYSGEPCEIVLDGEKVLTGYINRTYADLSNKSRLEIIGRGKCQDLVEASAEAPYGQIMGQNVLEVARTLAAPYGIEVVTAETDLGKPIQKINLNYGETAYSILERVCRYAALLLYEDADGRLVLSRVSSNRAGALIEGQNMQLARVLKSSDQRFSEVAVALTSIQTFADGGNVSNVAFSVPDPNVKRNRKLYIIAEAAAGEPDLNERRARWEVSRRAGRSFQVVVKADSWRDGDGKLWKPNTVVPVAAPSIGLARTDMIVSAVTFMQETQAGTWAEILLMPKEAYSIEPINLFPVGLDIQETTNG